MPTTPFFSAKIAPDVALRALAIMWVVLNHSAAVPDRPFELGGGLNILLLLSGYSFARFTLTHREADRIRASIVQFSLHLLLPCLAIVLVSFVVKRQFSIGELMFVSNFYQLEHISSLYAWYPQSILQMMVVFWLSTFVHPVVKAIARRPLALSIGVTLVSFIVMLLLNRLLHDAPYARRIFYNVVWNFTIGWAVYFANAKPAPLGLTGRFGLIALAAILSYFASPEWLRLVALTSGVAILLLVTFFHVPSVAARMLTVISQATFTIFLLQVYFLRAFDILHFRQYQSGFHLRDVLSAWSFTMLGALVVWILLASTSRAWRYALSNKGILGRTDEIYKPINSAPASM